MSYFVLFDYYLLKCFNLIYSRVTMTKLTPRMPYKLTNWSITPILLTFPNSLLSFCCTDRLSDWRRRRDTLGLHRHPDLFWMERGWHPVCPTICVMFLASHQALLSGNSARRLMCAGGAAEHSANSVQQNWILCHMTAPKGAENHSMLPLCKPCLSHSQNSSHNVEPWLSLQIWIYKYPNYKSFQYVHLNTCKLLDSSQKYRGEEDKCLIHPTWPTPSVSLCPVSNE